MMIRDYGDIESERDRSDNEGMPSLEDSDGDELALSVEESLVIIYNLYSNLPPRQLI
jgi:hypothetical protein